MIRPASNRPSAPDRHGFVAAAMFFVVAMLIRFHHLDGQSLWNDEMFSIDLARSSFPALLQKLTTSYHHPPLFFSILHVIFRFFDDSVQALRFVPALAGSVTVSVVYLLGRRICNNPAGISAATLCLVSPFHLAYSQEGRPYSLAALLTLVAFFLIAEYIDSQKRRRLILYMLTAIALLYTHYWGLFVVGGHVLFVLCYPLAASIKKSFFLVFLFVALAFVPVLPALLVQSSAEHAGGWWWVETPSFQEAADVVGAYAGSSFNMASSVFQQDPWIQLIGLISCCALILSAMFGVMRKEADLKMQALFISIAAPLAVPFALSFYRHEAFIWYRHTVILFPLFCVLMGCVAFRGKWKRVLQVLIGILLMIGVAGTVKYFSWSKSNVRDVAVYTEFITREGVDLIIRPRAFAPLLNSYYRGHAVQLDEAYLDEPLGDIVDTARAFVYISLDVPNEIRTYMNSHFVRIQEKQFPGEAHMGIVVGVYRQKAEPPDVDPG